MGGGDVEEEVEKKDGKGAKEGVKTRAGKRDFFGRVIKDASGCDERADAERKMGKGEKASAGDEGRVWVSFHEGFSNAVRKPITLDELMRGV
jgi:chromosome transmission fidelity protein 18